MQGIHVPSWFYIFAGIILTISGLAQIFLHARAEGARSFMKPAGLFSMVSVVIGLMVIYFGLFIHR